MAKVDFTYNNGRVRAMLPAHAEALQKMKYGTYMTRDMVAERAVPVAEVDSEGQRWDETMHVASKAKNKDGTWRKKPGAKA
jgi:hypothetical protein